MVVAYSTEGLLVPHEQLDAAIAVVEQLSAAAGLLIERIEVTRYFDPELPTPPIELISAIPSPDSPIAIPRLTQLWTDVARELRERKLKSPFIPLDVDILPTW